MWNKKLWSEAKLVEKLKNGSDPEKAVNMFYQMYFSEVELNLRSVKAEPEQIEDIFQEIAMSTIVNIGAFDPEKASLKTYVKKIAFKKYYTLVRDTSLHQEKELHFLEKQLEQDPNIDFMLKDEAKEGLELLLNNIDESCKVLLKSFFFEGKSLTDIADEVGLKNADSAYKKKSLCLEKAIKFLNTDQEIKELLTEYLSKL